MLIRVWRTRMLLGLLPLLLVGTGHARTAVRPSPPKLVGIAYSPHYPPWTFDGAWSSPVGGGYRSDDPTMFRRHTAQLEDAGVDFLWLDWSNAFECGDQCCSGAAPDHCSVFRNIESLFRTRAAIRTPAPKLAVFVGADVSTVSDGRLRRQLDLVHRTFIANAAYAAVYQRWHAKPLLAVYWQSLPGGLPAFDDARFALRWMTGWIDDRAYLRDDCGSSDWWSFKDRTRSGRCGPYAPTFSLDPRFAAAVPEHAAVTTAFPGVQGWTDTATNATRNGGHDCQDSSSGEPGRTFDEQWLRVRNVDPELVTVATFNEWVVTAGPRGDQWTPACSSDIEPSAPFGDMYLRRLKARIAEFRGYRDDIALYDRSGGTWLFRNNPSFSFETSYRWRTPAASVLPFACDVDGDGYGDLGLRDGGSGRLVWRYGPGFDRESSQSGRAGGQYQVFTGDANGDGQCDVGLRDTGTGAFFWSLGSVSGFGAERHAFTWTSGTRYQVFAGDFDGDGLADIGLRDTATGELLWRRGPDYSRDVSRHLWAAGEQYQVFAGDLDGDGIWDLGLRDTGTGNMFWKSGPAYSDGQHRVLGARGPQIQVLTVDLR